MFPSTLFKSIPCPETGFCHRGIFCHFSHAPLHDDGANAVQDQVLRVGQLKKKKIVNQNRIEQSLGNSDYSQLYNFQKNQNQNQNQMLATQKLALKKPVNKLKRGIKSSPNDSNLARGDMMKQKLKKVQQPLKNPHSKQPAPISKIGFNSKSNTLNRDTHSNYQPQNLSNFPYTTGHPTDSSSTSSSSFTLPIKTDTQDTDLQFELSESHVPIKVRTKFLKHVINLHLQHGHSQNSAQALSRAIENDILKRSDSKAVYMSLCTKGLIKINQTLQPQPTPSIPKVKPALKSCLKNSSTNSNPNTTSSSLDLVAGKTGGPLATGKTTPSYGSNFSMDGPPNAGSASRFFTANGRFPIEKDDDDVYVPAPYVPGNNLNFGMNNTNLLPNYSEQIPNHDQIQT
eukprot:TRINITY_DN442_c0_g1_i1.p1 TRINITY_DN442_c0_g1~~TRINITY_DN442_c0_g1_i1.p1  ORF type:complete len:399 (+),score=68.31 TRINITY_DN442_c0_g1_i1:21-1217(+)